jgi:hypothetical protein
MIRIALIFLFSISVTSISAQKKSSGDLHSTDTLICDQNFTDISNESYSTSLKREIVGTFPVLEGDSIQYSVFREKSRKAVFFTYNSQGKEIIKTPFTSNVIAGNIAPGVKGNYYFKVKSKSLLPNTFIVTVKKRNCAYQKKALPPPAPPPVYKTDTTVTIKLDSTIYLACKLDLKNKQSIIIPVDSLRGSVFYEIRSSTGAVKYRFLNSKQHEVKRGNSEYDKGELKGERYNYKLVIENDDKVVGKHVYINIKQVYISRELLEQE